MPRKNKVHKKRDCVSFVQSLNMANEMIVYQAAEAAGVFAFGLTEEGFGDATAEIIADTTNRFTNST